MVVPTPSLILYGTTCCHLCEQAESVLAEVGVVAHSVDIVDDDVLIDRYGVRIPVLRRDDGAELGWPFDAARVRQWLAIRA